MSIQDIDDLSADAAEKLRAEIEEFNTRIKLPLGNMHRAFEEIKCTFSSTPYCNHVRESGQTR